MVWSGATPPVETTRAGGTLSRTSARYGSNCGLDSGCCHNLTIELQGAGYTSTKTRMSMLKSVYAFRSSASPFAKYSGKALPTCCATTSKLFRGSSPARRRPVADSTKARSETGCFNHRLPQLFPPAANTNCVHQLCPSTVSINCFHQLFPPADS